MYGTIQLAQKKIGQRAATIGLLGLKEIISPELLFPPFMFRQTKQG